MANASDPAEWFGEAEFEYPAGSGNQFTITLDNFALVLAEGALDISMLEWLPQLYETIKARGNPMMGHLAALIYGGLKQNHPKITQRDVVNMAMSRDEGLRQGIIKALAGIEIPADAVAEVGNAPAAPANRKARRATTAKKKKP